MDSEKLDSRPFYRGAEADLSFLKIDAWKAVEKCRKSKEYRNKSLDENIRRQRTFLETAILHEAKSSGIRVPSILGIDKENTSFMMSQIEGVVARDCLDGMTRRNAEKLFRSVGEEIGLLHLSGIVHGDLTTSNIIVTQTGFPFIVDFGMARRSVEAEDRGIDLHLLQRSIATSHRKDPKVMFKALARGYEKAGGRIMMESSWAKAREIGRRGRYFALR